MPAPTPKMDLYGKLVQRVLFPAWEKLVRKRPTLGHLDDLMESQWLSLPELKALQARELSTLLSHAYQHTPYYRRIFDELGLRPEDITGPDEITRLPILTREGARTSVDDRISQAPPYAVVKKTTSGTLGDPLPIRYNLESEYWRNAVRMRGYSWAGYDVGAKSLHYWGRVIGNSSFKQRTKISIDRAIKREVYVDCTPRGDAYLAEVVDTIAREKPAVILTYSQAGGDLARYVLRSGRRSWGTIPVICGAERLFQHDRDALEGAFGPAVFETYGCREFMLMGTECDAHDGLHVQMENVIVEIVVRDNGQVRTAEPGEVGEVAVTDLHNLGMPLIRYLNGDRATAREPEPCKCGRAMPRIGPIEGRVTETLRDGDGNPVSGLIFNIIFCDLAASFQQFQAIQHKNSDITLKLIPVGEMSSETSQRVDAMLEKYLPGITVRAEIVDEIPVTAAGKRRVVIVER